MTNGTVPAIVRSDATTWVTTYLLNEPNPPLPPTDVYIGKHSVVFVHHDDVGHVFPDGCP